MFLVLLVGSLLWGACFSAQNCYIAATGSDNNNCTSQNPCSTIAHCLTALQGDVTISLSTGVYSGIDNCYTNVNPNTYAGITNLVIQGLPGNNVTIDCSNTDNYHFHFLNVNATFTISSVTLANGNSADNGGCVSASNITGLTIQNVVFTGCYAVQNGGALYTDSPSSISDSTFYGNGAGNNGGAAAVLTSASTNVSMSRCNVTGNYAEVSGGALAVTGPYLQFTSGNITLNSALQYGGGVYLSVATSQENFIGVYNVLYSTISRNNATLGGGLYSANLNHTWNFYGATLTNNTITNTISNHSDPNIYCGIVNSTFCFSCLANDCVKDCGAGINQTCSQNTAMSQVFCYSQKYTGCSATDSCTCAAKSGLPTAAKIMIVFIGACMVIGIVLILIDVVRHFRAKKQGYTPIA